MHKVVLTKRPWINGSKLWLDPFLGTSMLDKHTEQYSVHMQSYYHCLVYLILSPNCPYNINVYRLHTVCVYSCKSLTPWLLYKHNTCVLVDVECCMVAI